MPKPKRPKFHIGTSGWHYGHWSVKFYPPGVKGYQELRYYAERYDSVENNASFYRVSKPETYKIWDRMTPPGFTFSLKLNRFITHLRRLKLEAEVKERLAYILDSLQTLGDKLGALVIQLPPSLAPDHERLDAFLAYLCKEIGKREHAPDLAIEFRHPGWFAEETYAFLKKHNVALVAAQSSRYPGERHLTADIAYIRLHGPKELFASKYSRKQLEEWAAYIRKVARKTKRVYVYFNNDLHGYAIKNAKELQKLLGVR